MTPDYTHSDGSQAWTLAGGWSLWRDEDGWSLSVSYPSALPTCWGDGWPVARLERAIDAASAARLLVWREAQLSAPCTAPEVCLCQRCTDERTRLWPCDEPDEERREGEERQLGAMHGLDPAMPDCE